MNMDDINDFVPSLLNPRSLRKQNGGLSLTQNSCASRSSLSLKRNGLKQNFKAKAKVHLVNKENLQNIRNLINNNHIIENGPRSKKTIDNDSLGFSAIADLQSVVNNLDSPPIDVNECDIPLVQANTASDCVVIEPKLPLVSVSSNTELDHSFDTKSESTVIYNVKEKAAISISFGINNCQNIDINSKNSNIKRVVFSQKDDNTLVDCEIIESSQLSTESELDENVNEPPISNSLKRSGITVNLEIKKNNPSEQKADYSKVLILNTSAVEKISHVVVQPPNYRLVKKNISDRSQIKSVTKRNSVSRANVSNAYGRLRQKSIDSFFNNLSKDRRDRSLGGSQLVTVGQVKNGEVWEMNKNSFVDKSGHRSPSFTRSDNEASGRPIRLLSPIKAGSLDTSYLSPRGKIERSSSHSPRKNVDSHIQITIPSKSASTKKSLSSAKPVPHHKIIAGTHFAVDAFCYGEIQNVKHYFLTHFHSDHYSGLKKTFNKMLFCSKITADLCMTRLGVSPKYIHIIKIDETIKVDGVEVTAVEANHCPGALMLIFTLPNGKTMLHTGDFRATPLMESYPVFWNKDIHTVYLDTTYCNPRYDFPTQDQSLEMALFILRQKKMALEKVGKKFSSVLIVCGTYTIGKEKFFLGMSRRVGCSVWACPEKDRVLQTVEGRSFGHAPAQSCQLHVVPMRDLTHEKLRAYLDTLKGTFSEVVAFKPSGWENGKSPSIEKDMVTIHGIPYSEHSSFSELIRFVKFLGPKQVIPTVDISGGVKAVQKYFPCPLVYKEGSHCQSKLTDFFSIQNQQQVPAVT